MVEQYIAVAAEQAPYMAAVVLAYFAGASTPFGFIIERLRGFGRATVSQLPYQPPPGMDRETALMRASSHHDPEDIEEGAQDGADNGGA